MDGSNSGFNSDKLLATRTVAEWIYEQGAYISIYDIEREFNCSRRRATEILYYLKISKNVVAVTKPLPRKKNHQSFLIFIKQVRYTPKTEQSKTRHALLWRLALGQKSCL